MDLFESKQVITRAHLQRAALTFGKLIGPIQDKKRQSDIIGKEMAEYRATDGGSWNYDDVLHGLVQIARGAKVEDLEKHCQGLKGAGEAHSKTTLLKEVVKNTPILKGNLVEVGAREISLGEEIFLQIKYDFSILVEGEVYCFLIFPTSKALKDSAKYAIIREFAQPFAGMDRPHKLVYVENPIISERRAPKTEIRDFQFGGINVDFREHLKISELMMQEP